MLVPKYELTFMDEWNNWDKLDDKQKDHCHGYFGVDKEI